MAVRSAAFCLFLLLLSIAGCESDAPRQDTKRAAPRYNLTGYPPAFKQGYADACATPRRRNELRFKEDTDYQIGWQDGNSVCRAR